MTMTRLHKIWALSATCLAGVALVMRMADKPEIIPVQQKSDYQQWAGSVVEGVCDLYARNQVPPGHLPPDSCRENLDRKAGMILSHGPFPAASAPSEVAGEQAPSKDNLADELLFYQRNYSSPNLALALRAYEKGYYIFRRGDSGEYVPPESEVNEVTRVLGNREEFHQRYDRLLNEIAEQIKMKIDAGFAQGSVIALGENPQVLSEQKACELMWDTGRYKLILWRMEEMRTERDIKNDGRLPEINALRSAAEDLNDRVRAMLLGEDKKNDFQPC